jgi:hypothetical protein
MMTTTSNARGAGRGQDGEAPGATTRPGIPELERRFTELTNLLYDTAVPAAVLQENVYPFLAPDIEFKDPWVKASGLRHFWIGLKGFHAVIRFDFRIFQLAVQLNERGDGGRVLVDGVMNQPFQGHQPCRSI